MNYHRPRILIVDNYDSFTFNLVQILREDGRCDFDIGLDDTISIAAAGRYDGFLFSPGPGVPAEAPVMAELLGKYSGSRSFLGVCLGHQAIAETFGLKLAKLDIVRHGVRANVRLLEPHDRLFRGMPAEFSAGLYHSWGVYNDPKTPYSDLNLRVTAIGNDGIIMALAHNGYNIRGVQFHPESFMTDYGSLLLQNWVDSLLD
ncbi:aminodeoxychorismate/anthranilate synthase component II [bacterium]|nr:aminodeoxychorismate/anthranilate synthase component II [bacterium]